MSDFRHTNTTSSRNLDDFKTRTDNVWTARKQCAPCRHSAQGVHALRPAFAARAMREVSGGECCQRRRGRGHVLRRRDGFREERRRRQEQKERWQAQRPCRHGLRSHRRSKSLREELRRTASVGGGAAQRVPHRGALRDAPNLGEGLQLEVANPRTITPVATRSVHPCTITPVATRSVLDLKLRRSASVGGGAAQRVPHRGALRDALCFPTRHEGGVLDIPHSCTTTAAPDLDGTAAPPGLAQNLSTAMMLKPSIADVDGHCDAWSIDNCSSSAVRYARGVLLMWRHKLLSVVDLSGQHSPAASAVFGHSRAASVRRMARPSAGIQQIKFCRSHVRPPSECL